MVEQDYPNLQRVVANALCDESFRDRLLNGDRQQVIEAFDLAEAERDAILAIKADTIETFAQTLLGWMDQHNAL